MVVTDKSFSLWSNNLEVTGSLCSNGPLTSSNWMFSVSPWLCAPVVGTSRPSTPASGPDSSLQLQRRVTTLCQPPPSEDEGTDPELQGP